MAPPKRVPPMPIKNPSLCCLLVSALLPLAGSAQTFSFSKIGLVGGQEVPPNVSAASGVATLTLDEPQTNLAIQIRLTGIDLDGNQTVDPNDDLTGLHIHRGVAGVNGPVVFGLINPNNDLDADLVIDPVNGTIHCVWDVNERNGTTLAAELANLLGKALYINVHTVGTPSGEIRGQIVPRIPAIKAPRKTRSNRRNARFRVRVEADLAATLRARANRARAIVRGKGPFVVTVKKSTRRVTTVRLSAKDTDGQAAKRKTTKVIQN